MTTIRHVLVARKMVMMWQHEDSDNGGDTFWIVMMMTMATV